METASATIILVPSQRAGIVRLKASNSSCASCETPFPRRASPSRALPIAVISLFFRARMSRACTGGTASVNEPFSIGEDCDCDCEGGGGDDDDDDDNDRIWKFWIRETGIIR